MSAWKSSNPSLKIRRRTLFKDQTINFLEDVKKLYYWACESNYTFEVSGLPLSLNHQKKRALRWTKNGKRYLGEMLKPEVEHYREWFILSYRKGHPVFTPKGTLAVVLEIHNPEWLTQKNTVAEKDADNLVKPIFDALQRAIDWPDQNIFNHHVFKVVGPEKKVVIHLYDMGDVVNCHL